jgi:hypothetical protein
MRVVYKRQLLLINTLRASSIADDKLTYVINSASRRTSTGKLEQLVPRYRDGRRRSGRVTSSLRTGQVFALPSGELQPLPYERIVSDNPSDAPGQEHQVGRFLSIFEQRLAWCSYLSTHGQPTR